MSELVERIRESLLSWGEAPVLMALRSDGSTISVTAPELLRKRDETAALLRSQGVRRDDVVALFLENSIEYVAVILALLEIRAVPLFAKLEFRRREVMTLFADIDPDAIVAEEAYLPTIAPFLSGRGVLVRSGGGGHSGSSLKPLASPERHNAQSGISEEAASINCTYRGDGELLGSIATASQYLLGAEVLQAGLQGERGERMLYPIPLSHIFTLVGCLFVPLLKGMTGILAGTVHPRVLFDSFDRLRVNHVTAVPEIYRLLLKAKREDRHFPALRTFVSGGSVLHAGEYDALTRSFSLEVLHGYGLTEFTPVSRNCRGASRPGTVGPVCEGLEVRIDDPDSLGRGEILLRGSALGAGYYNKPHRTRHAYWNGWFATGDSGHFEGEHLVFDGEIKQTRKVNGVMVDLQEVRGAILSATTAADVRVEFGDGGISALLVLAESTDIDKEEKRLRQVLDHQLARYKIPRHFKIAP